MSTDHKAEALNFLIAATIDTHGDDDRKVAIAQVHATLALVEELRTATLAAVTQRDLNAGFGIPTERLEELDRRLS